MISYHYNIIIIYLKQSFMILYHLDILHSAQNKRKRKNVFVSRYVLTLLQLLFIKITTFVVLFILKTLFL